jgi:hypothetical protein
MSKISIEGNALGTGTFTIAAPNSNTSYTLTLPESTGTMVVTGGAQTIEFAAGTVSAPSITTTGDTNTGIYFPAADTIAFAEGGAEAMRIDSSGNVGVGTTSPSTYGKFAVSGLAFGSSYYVTSSSGGGAGGARFGAYFGSVNVGYVDHAVTDGTGGAEKADIRFGTINSGTLAERARIDSSGNLLFNSGYGSVATAYGCRAWVNFDGTTNVGGNCTIRASGNVSSVTDNGAGDYTVNFTTAMPDANYGFALSCQGAGAGNNAIVVEQHQATNPTTTALRVLVKQVATALDRGYVCVSIFR